MPAFRTLTALVVAGVLAPAQAPAYRNRAAVQSALEALVKAHPGKATLERIGSSAEGRPLWVLRVGSPKADRAVFVAANLEGHAHSATAAAFHLVETLLAAPQPPEVAWLVAPMLNPDTHDGMWEPGRWLRAAGKPLDHDLDGLVGEDGPDDLDGDGLIRQLRIPDPAGGWLPDPADPRVMIPADPAKGRLGTHRLSLEGKDDDGDGAFNEDPASGHRPEKGYPRAFPLGDREAGPWPGVAPEPRAVMDFLLAHREIALAVVLGPGNTLLEVPKAGAAGLTDASRVRPTMFMARAMGLDPTQEVTVAELWASVKDRAEEFGFTKEDVLQELQPGEVQAPPPDDTAFLERMAEPFRKALEAKGLDPKRPSTAPAGGTLWPWLYYHYGALAVALDVWGPPKAKAGSDLWAFADAHAPEAIRPWKPVKLADGRTAEVGGLDPYLALAPPPALLKPALEATTEVLLGWSRQLPKVALGEVSVKALGGGLWRVTASARNVGAWPTHTRMGVRTRAWMPVRLELSPGAGVVPEGLQRAATAERLEPGATLQGAWVLRGAAGAQVTVTLRTHNAGGGTSTVTLGQER